MLEKIQQVPVLNVRGSHYTVGFSIGRTFRNLIEDFLNNWKYFNQILLPVYDNEAGKKIYEGALRLCKNKFPQYVNELEGMADGASVPFHHLFLLHIETLIAPVNDEGMAYGNPETPPTGLMGCTSILVNGDEILLGHTEDAAPDMTNSFFIVCAEIIGRNGETLEEFSTLTYPGYLPGYTMGYNAHGIVYSVNTIYPSRTFSDRTSVHFLCRALMGTKSFEEIKSLLLDKGTGLGDGFSLNLIIAQGSDEPIVCNIEIGPNQREGDESELDIEFVSKGASGVHCNRYLRLDIENQCGPSQMSTIRRHAAIAKLETPRDGGSVKRILSDRSDQDFPVYREAEPVSSVTELSGTDSDKSSTIAVGLFDLKKKTWSIYTSPPACSKASVILPLNF